MGLRDRLRGLMGFFRRTKREVRQATREPVDHVILLDGTMSTLEEGDETNVGLIFKLLDEVSASRPVALLYEAGNQWEDWSKTLDIIEGRGINRQIRRCYGWLASRYREGDRVFLIGYSRGAYAVRSLVGVIDQIGLLKPEHVSDGAIQDVYQLYRTNADDEASSAFRDAYCHADVPIEVVGVFDTVKSLGFRAPFVWKWEEVKHSFHNHHLSPIVKHGFHALALDETREAYTPVLWESHDGFKGRVEQVWFRGSHGDVGGQLSGFYDARPLSNIPLVWMLEKLAACSLPLPDGWRGRFPMDADGPSCGSWRGWGKYFLARKKRVVGADPSEGLHPSALGRSRRAVKVGLEVRTG